MRLYKYNNYLRIDVTNMRVGKFLYDDNSYTYFNIMGICVRKDTWTINFYWL